MGFSTIGGTGPTNQEKCFVLDRIFLDEGHGSYFSGKGQFPGEDFPREGARVCTGPTFQDLFFFSCGSSKFCEIASQPADYQSLVQAGLASRRKDARVYNHSKHPKASEDARVCNHLLRDVIFVS